jgi:hypothetical protein
MTGNIDPGVLQVAQAIAARRGWFTSVGIKGGYSMSGARPLAFAE